ncbi:MAG: HRDC domain-containing protein, partial [Ilumatobacteraceae bacterium]
SGLLADLPTSDEAPTSAAVLAPIAHREAKPTLHGQLVNWRAVRARQLRQLPKVVCSDRELTEIEQTQPDTVEALAEIIGSLTAKQLASEILPIVASFKNSLSGTK